MGCAAIASGCLSIDEFVPEFREAGVLMNLC